MPIRKLGSADDVVHILDDGTVKLEGDATVFNEAVISGLAMGVGTSAIAVIPNCTFKTPTFVGATTVNDLYGTVLLPGGYKEGSSIVPSVRFAPGAAGAGNVRLLIEYAWANKNGVVTAGTIVNAVVASSAVVGTVQKLDFAAIVGTAKTAGSTLFFRLYREPENAGDTSAATIHVVDVSFKYECDTLGYGTVTAK